MKMYMEKLSASSFDLFELQTFTFTTSIQQQAHILVRD